MNITSAGSVAPYGMLVSSSGALPVAGQSGGAFYTLLTDTSGRLVLAANIVVSGDISIGAVELKNQADDSRAAVIGSALWVMPRPSQASTGSIGAITSGNETAILTQVMTGSSYLFGWSAHGTADARLAVYKDSTLLESQRINVFADRTASNKYGNPLLMAAGSIIVKAVHGETLSQGFEASITWSAV